MNTVQSRLVYPDICKFLAIFLVTWSHCAQCISGETWTNFLGGHQIDIAFNMPLFMIMSGWFLNPQKLRIYKFSEYVKSKFRRLIVPAFTWYALMQFLSFRFIGFGIFTFYWYLSALFVCLVVIMLFCKFIKNNFLCCILSTIIVLITPGSSFCNINFMFPFIWCGYYIRQFIEHKRISWGMVIIPTFIGIILLKYWSANKTVYLCNFDLLHFTMYSLIVYIYRFIIGLVLSFAIILMVKKLEYSYLARLAKYGGYSLVIYTASLFFIALYRRIYIKIGIDFTITDFGIIDLASLVISVVLIWAIIKITNIIRENRFLKILLLGE